MYLLESQDSKFDDSSLRDFGILQLCDLSIQPGVTILQNDLGKPVENQRNHKIWCLVQISDSRINHFCHRRRLVEMIPAIIDQTFPNI